MLRGTESGSDQTSAWRRWASAAGSLILGAVLLVAAWPKAIDPEAFAEQIVAEGLDLGVPAMAVAVAAVALEAGLGTALVLGLRRRWVLWTSTALVAFFLFLTGRAYWRFSQGLIDADEACGCFGNLINRTPAEAFWQDLLLLVPPLALAWLGVSRTAGRRRLTAAWMAAVAAAVLAWRAPALPLDDLATRLAPGVEIADLCAGAEDDPARVCLDALVPQLESGRHLVVVAALGEPALVDGVGRLNELAADPAAPELWLVTPSTPEERQAFFWSHGPSFEIREAPEALLRPLYRSPPRSFVVEEGTVTRTFSGLPPHGVENR